jgi:hypothetical protein
MCFTPDAPDPVDPAKVGRDTLQTQIDLFPKVFDLEQQYQPLYTDLGNENLYNQLFGRQLFTVSDASKALQTMDPATKAQVEAEAAKWGFSPAQWLQGHITEQAGLGDASALDAIAKSGSRTTGLLKTYTDMSPVMTKLQSDANSAQREADIADVERLGGRAREAFKSANPELTAAMEALSRNVSSSRGSVPQVSRSGLMTNLEGKALDGFNPTQIQSVLQKQALDELGSGGRLSAEGMRTAQQMARAAAADRGMVFNNSTLLDEAMNAESMRQQRLDKSRGFALTVDEAGQNNLNSARNFATGVAGMGNQLDMANAELARAAQNDQFSREFNLAGMLQSQAQDPYQMVLGRSGAPNQVMGAVGQAGAQQQGPKYFNPFDPNITSIYAANNSNEMAANIAGANNNSSIFGSLLGAGGMLGGAAIICWAARAVYGENDDRWLKFREYMLRRAPSELFESYASKGRELASRIKRSRTLRRKMNKVMDRILAQDLAPTATN